VGVSLGITVAVADAVGLGSGDGVEVGSRVAVGVAVGAMTTGAAEGVEITTSALQPLRPRSRVKRRPTRQR
jgi:hypothetical protein